MGITLASLHKLRKTPVLNDKLKTFTKFILEQLKAYRPPGKNFMAQKSDMNE